MNTEDLIAVNEFCLHYNIEYSFIQSLSQSGLIEVTNIEETSFIHANELAELEKFIRLHYELDINEAGIEAIAHLLQRIHTLHRELTTLKNQLRLYEKPE